MGVVRETPVVEVRVRQDDRRDIGRSRIVREHARDVDEHAISDEFVGRALRVPQG